MAQKRMLDKKISVSEQVANLEPVGQLIFTWSIAHADDVGVLPGSLRTLRAMIVPQLDLSLEEFEEQVQAIVKEDLWQKFDYSSKDFYRLPQFFRTQTLKKDRQPQTILPIVVLTNPKDTWKLLEDIGFQMEPEGKRREEKKEEESATPSIPVFERKIREKDEEYRDLVKDLAAKDYLSPDKIHKIALEEFLPYWLERGEGAKKSRWEKEKAFDYQRRFRTWIKTHHTILKDVKCTAADSWHRKGETCHHEKPEPDYKNLPVSEYGKALGPSKRITH